MSIDNYDLADYISNWEDTLKDIQDEAVALIEDLVLIRLVESGHLQLSDSGCSAIRRRIAKTEIN